MRYIFTLLLMLALVNKMQAQTTYNATMYAKTGDTFYITIASPDTVDFYTAGANKTWDFSKLKGVSQQQLIFRSPKSTGFNQLQWPYIYNTNNVNLSSANNQSVSIGALQESNNNDYFLLNSNALALKASSFTVAYNNVALAIKNVYSAADTVYKFPLNYTDTFASNAGFTTTIPGVYYSRQTVTRTNKVDGYGKAITPYGTFSNCIRVTSDVIQTDTFSFYGVGVPLITAAYRELKWLDASKGCPVLYVKQGKTPAGYVTQVIEYLAAKEYYQPQALFAYVPVLPVKNDTVTFQNLSTNSAAWLWNFGDGTTATSLNPKHIYAASGKYAVKLVAYNGALTDTIVINITVTDNPLPIKLLSFNGAQAKNKNILQWVTTQEINSHFFAVERSVDGLYFVQLATVTAYVNSASNMQYSYADVAPLKGNNYYRLKMVDKDGKYSYSNIVIVEGIVGGTKTPMLWPNPARNNQQAILSVNPGSAGKAALYVTNLAGKIIVMKNIQLTAGENNITLSTAGLLPGSYFVSCTHANKHLIAHEQLLIVQ